MRIDLFFVLLFSLLAGDLLACRCSSIPTVEEAYEQADFVGRVRINTVEKDPFVDRQSGVKIEATVLELFKGRHIWGSSVVIYSYTATEKCGYQFEPGMEALIYPTSKGDRYIIEGCARITMNAGGVADGEDISSLRKIRTGSLLVEKYLGEGFVIDSVQLIDSLYRAMVSTHPAEPLIFRAEGKDIRITEISVSSGNLQHQGTEYTACLEYKLDSSLADKEQMQSFLAAMFGNDPNKVGIGHLGNEEIPLEWRIHDRQRGDDPLPFAVQFSETLDSFRVWKHH